MTALTQKAQVDPIDSKLKRSGLIDTDVHQALDASFWNEYLPEPWRHMTPPAPGFSWPAHAIGHHGNRQDVQAGDDAKPDAVLRDLVEEYGFDYAVLTGSHNLRANVHPNAGFGMAFARAYNDWLIDKWLNVDPRFLGCMLVAPQDIPGSVAEIERVGSHKQIVQVIMAASSPLLYGKRYFWPMYEAAEAAGLPVSIHALGHLPSASGWPSTYLEHHTTLPTREFMDHLVSIICEGVFEQFPKLKYVFIEGGVTVYAPLLWRLDKNWKAVRAEAPWLTRRPSEYLPTNVRFTTQPIEEPDDEELLLKLFESLYADQTIMFASDWPHWDFDSPTAILQRFPKSLQERIFSGNARDLYGLAPRAAAG